MRHLLVVSIATLSTLIFISVKAEENFPSGDRFIDNLSSEYAACASYFTIVQAAVTNAGDTEAAARYEKLANAALEYARTFAQETRTEEMADKVTLSRYGAYIQAMSEEIGNDAANISILFNQHTYRCKEAMEEPEKFANKIMIDSVKGEFGISQSPPVQE